jgi:hypothetical protein
MLITNEKGGISVRLQVSLTIALVCVFTVVSSFSQDDQPKKPSKKTSDSVSFKKDVFPIIEKSCLPCHAVENLNKSELSLDDYETMKAGGKNGPAVVAGKSEESLLVQKLKEPPPFGERMPMNSKKKIAAGKAKWLTEEEVKAIARWIDEGARNN